MKRRRLEHFAALAQRICSKLAAMDTAVTILFGALPAAYLCLWAGMAVAFGFERLASGDVALGMLILSWALAGFYGTVSLWLVVFNGPRRIVAGGLVVGILAILPICIAVMRNPSLTDGIFGAPLILLVVTPPIVALAWLIRLARTGPPGIRDATRPLEQPPDDDALQ